MHSSFRVAVLVAFLLPFAAAPVLAQDWRFDVGINGGGSWYSPSLDDEHLGISDASVRFEPGWLVGAQATGWFHPNIGIRANFAYTERPLELETDNNEVINGFGDGDNLAEDINLWSGTGDVLIRFLGPNPRRFIGFELLPYLALGLGAKWVDPAFGGTDDQQPFAVGDQLFAVDDDTKLMGLVGLGADHRITRRLAIRTEIGDRIWDSPIRRVDPFTDEDDDEDVGDVINELYGQVGVHYLFGLAEPEPVEAAPAPPPPPAPEPEEERIRVCVIDPTQPGQLTEVEAIRDPATRDTLIEVNGERVAITDATRDAVVAREADWYVAGEPLAIEVEDERREFVTFGGARTVATQDLVFLGTVDGLPVYGDANEIDRLSDRDDDLETILMDEDTREEFDQLDVVYVPLDATGCVFQPLRRVEEVRGVRGG